MITLAELVRLGLLERFGEANLPSDSYFGDGAAIRDNVVDDMLVAHGREPFTGPRELAVAMAEPHSGQV